MIQGFIFTLAGWPEAWKNLVRTSANFLITHRKGVCDAEDNKGV